MKRKGHRCAGFFDRPSMKSMLSAAKRVQAEFSAEELIPYALWARDFSFGLRRSSDAQNAFTICVSNCVPEHRISSAIASSCVRAVRYGRLVVSAS